MEIPSGKGFFIEYVDHVGNGDWGSVIPTGQNMNIKWLAVRIMVGKTPANIRGAGVLSKDYAANLKVKCDRENIKLFGYLDFNSEDKFDQQASKTIERLKTLGLAGLIIHPIVPSKKLGDFFMVLDHSGFSLGLMSDLIPSDYRSPNIVASSVDYYMPYKVWGKGGSPTGWVDMYIDYRKYSQNPVIPVAPANTLNSWTPKSTEIAAFVQRASASGEDVPGVGFYKWDDKQKTGVDYNIDLRRAVMNASWRSDTTTDTTSNGSSTTTGGSSPSTGTPTPIPPVVTPPVVTTPTTTTPPPSSMDLSFTQAKWEAVYKDYLSRNGKM
jgi:hypothetical protein